MVWIGEKEEVGVEVGGPLVLILRDSPSDGM